MCRGELVEQLSPNSESVSGKTRKERRALWLILPEMRALRLRFMLKLSDTVRAQKSNKT